VRMGSRGSAERAPGAGGERVASGLQRLCLEQALEGASRCARRYMCDGTESATCRYGFILASGSNRRTLFASDFCSAQRNSTPALTGRWSDAWRASGET